MIQIYTGHGKGKTTASLGLIVRALGHNTPVVLAQFFKNPDTGEIDFLSNYPGVTILHPDQEACFFKLLDEDQKQAARDSNHDLFVRACKVVTDKLAEIDTESKEIQLLVVFDEMMSAVTNGAVSEAEVVSFIDSLPSCCELVMTGRNVPDSIADCADYITEMGKIKHPYDKGISARKKIEW